MALADTFGSMLVVWRWQFTSKNAKPSDLNIQEARCSMMVAAGMILSAAMLLNSSIDGLVKRDSPDGASEAFLVSCVTFFASFTLYIYKDLVGRILCSIVVISDARSSLCSGLVALAVISSEFLEKWWWWADNVMGLALGFYICFQAYTTIAEAQLILQDPDKSESDGSLDTPAEKEHLLFPSKDTDGGGNSKQYDIEKRKTKGARQNAKEADSSASTLPAT
mmetsp:Transcript_38202/g.62894  ORF Transcript_38202/g.62894 Transcript_38202/m.62894 type:complete len:222 (-) Transcript_38202:190-855(-)